MYSNENKKGFSILDLIVKIIFALLFIFILVWLFQKKVPNMKPFYSNVFRENINAMQEAGESYFTDDKMPKEIGASEKITLADLFNKKMVLPFVDQNGNSCNQYESYVMATKLEEGYELKTNLVCEGEQDYLVKILGCHTYCPTGNCVPEKPEPEEKTCTTQSVTQYQFKKEVTSTKTDYSCPSGYKLSGTKCTKTVLSDTKNAEKQTTTTRVDTKDATAKIISGTKTKVDTVVKTEKKYVNAEHKTTKTYVAATTKDQKVQTGKYRQKVTTFQAPIKNQKKVYKDAIKTTTPGGTKQEAYSCQKTRTERRCTTTTRTESYSCNCSSYVDSTGKTRTSCSTCYRSVPVESCSNVSVPYTDTCYRTVTVPATTTYSCPSGTTKEGSGSSLKCYTLSTTYSCPSGTTQEGSGSSIKCSVVTYKYYCAEGAVSEGSGENLKCYNVTKVKTCPSGTKSEGSGDSLKCYKETTTNVCPSGTTSEGSGSSLKCYTTQKTYSCPSTANYKEGSGASLKCYKVTDGKITYSCPSGYKLSGTKCSKAITETTTTLSCPSGYKLEGKKCNKYSTETINATGKKTTSTKNTYKWSSSKSLKGWTRTGKTRTVKGKKVCK